MACAICSIPGRRRRPRDDVLACPVRRIFHRPARAWPRSCTGRSQIGLDHQSPGASMSKFHLGWFLGPGITIQGWNEPGFAPGYDWTKPDIFVDAARALERACFDVFILEDSLGRALRLQGQHGLLSEARDHDAQVRSGDADALPDRRRPGISASRPPSPRPSIRPGCWRARCRRSITSRAAASPGTS